jgi:hypothetical protein
MSAIDERAGGLRGATIPVEIRLSAAWASLMFLYAYGDVFAYFRPGFIEDVIDRKAADFDIDQLFLLAISIYVAIPALMVVLCVFLRPAVNRRVNIVLGTLYAVTIVLATIGDDYVYYYVLSLLELAVALLIVRCAWRWPRP